MGGIGEWTKCKLMIDDLYDNKYRFEKELGIGAFGRVFLVVFTSWTPTLC